VQLRDVLNDGAALPLPTRSRYVVAIMCADKRGQSAVIYAARMPIGLVPPLLLLDYDVGPLHGGLFREIDARIRDLAAQCRAQGAIAFVPHELARHAMAAGLRCEPIPEELIPEELLLSAAHHVGSGSVKLCEPALEKSRTSAFGGALDFRLRCAALLTVGMCLDPAAATQGSRAMSGLRHRLDVAEARMKIVKPDILSVVIIGHPGLSEFVWYPHSLRERHESVKDLPEPPEGLAGHVGRTGVNPERRDEGVRQHQREGRGTAKAEAR